MSPDSGRYEALLAYPEGRSTPARAAKTASRLGYDGLIIKNALDQPSAPSVEQVAGTHDIDIATGVELHPEAPDDASGRLPHLRTQVDVVMVAGGSSRLNRFIATQRHVDVLSRAISPDTSFIEAGVVKNAIEHDVALELNLSPLSRRGGSRVRYLQQLDHLWRLVDHYGADFVVTMRPRSHLELRDLRSLRALGTEVGIDEEAIDRGTDTWGNIVERNRLREVD